MKIGDRVQMAGTQSEGTIVAAHELRIPGNPAKMFSVQFEDGRTIKVFAHLLKPVESS